MNVFFFALVFFVFFFVKLKGGNGYFIEMARQILGKKYLSPTEVATLLECTPSTIRNYVRNGRLRAERVGGRWLIDPDLLRQDFPVLLGVPVSLK